MQSVSEDDLGSGRRGPSFPGAEQEGTIMIMKVIIIVFLISH
jgi:hypothetical protein